LGTIFYPLRFVRRIEAQMRLDGCVNKTTINKCLSVKYGTSENSRASSIRLRVTIL
jgi:hypothetical protein